MDTELTPAETLGLLLHGLRSDLSAIRRHLQRGCPLSPDDRRDLQDMILEMTEMTNEQPVHTL